jgi:hypothetical protein
MPLSPTPYTQTGPWTSGGAPGVDAGFLNNLENFLRRPSGGTEGARWFLAAASYTTGAVGSVWIRTTSMGTTPVSASIDTSPTPPQNNSGTPSAANLNAYGLQIFEFATGTHVNSVCGGIYVVQY